MKTTVTPVKPLNFFLLTFLLSWIIWIPLTLSHFGIGPLHIPEGISNIVRLLGVLMPAVAALILTRRAGGKPAIRELMSRLVLWRVRWTWWVAAAIVQPALLVLTFFLYNRFWANPAIPVIAPGPAVGFIVNIFFLLLATLGEEIGWRGVALPALQQKKSAFTSSLILGFIWGIWHLPFWLLLDTFTQFGFAYVAMNFLLVIPMNSYITWFFNRGKSSILLAVAFHLTFNIVNTALLPVTINVGAFWVFIALEWVVGLLVIPFLQPKREPVAAEVGS